MDKPTILERVERIEKFIEGEQVYAKQQADPYIADFDAKIGRNFRDTPGKAAAASGCEQTALEAIINRIQGSTDYVRMIAGKIEEIGERVMGQLPSEPVQSMDAVNVNPDGTLDHTHIALSGLDQALARLHVAALRLECI